MRTSHAVIVAGLAAIISAGCETSDRTVTWQGKTIESGVMNVIAADGLATAGSAGGKYYALVRPLSDEVGVFEVRDYATGSLVFSGPSDNDGPFPLMFSLDGRTLYALQGKHGDALVAIDLQTAKVGPERGLPVPSADLLTGRRNADHTIIASDDDKVNQVVTAAGTMHVAEGQVRFDPAGNAWFRSGGAFVKLDRNGREAKGLTPPKWLAKDQTHVRGALRLVEKKETVEHRGAAAYLSTIWLEAPGNQRSETGFVGVVADLMAFGFVPGRDAVYLITNDGSYIVPLKVKATAEPQKAAAAEVTRSKAEPKRP